ncbi:LPP20 family lipoprotein [Candidatus Sumerlaeota bacterium]|nr:LPP20 family lipoprotein [Candidatus Sumerlaeota bacterium]
MKRIKTLNTGLFLLLVMASLAFSTAQTVVQSPEQAKLMAKRAAINDAQRNLAETIYGIRLDSKTTVRNFITENDVIRTELHALLQGAAVTDVRWDRHGTCTVKMEVPVAALQRTLQRRFGYNSDVIRATGQGAPNPVASPTPAAIALSPEESWHTLVIRATGSGTAPKDMADTPQGKLMAERAAYSDALRQLGENVMGVHITSRTTVRNYITQNDTIKTRFQSFLQNARRVETRHLEDGICEVDLEIPLETLRPYFVKPVPPTPTPRYPHRRGDRRRNP